MSINYKNILLEYFQKNKLEFPKFDSKKVGGEDHIPIWYSIVDFNGDSFESELKKTKIDAEQSVCKKILESLGSNPTILIKNQSTQKVILSKSQSDLVESKILSNLQSIQKVKLTKNIALIVDLENNFNYESMENIYETYENLYMVGICSRNLNLKKEPTFEKMVVKSIAKDSADVAIIIFITQLILSKKYESIILLTRDHFGKTFEEVVNSGDLIDVGTTITITHVMNDTEVHDFLSKYKL